MTSQAKVRANRRNAAFSTGPRTAAGKDRSRRNSFRHGLTLPIKAGDARAAQIAQLADDIIAIAGARPEIARAVAEARLELIRARQAYSATIEQGIWEQVGTPEESSMHEQRLGLAVAAKAPRLIALDRYERRAWSRLKKCLTLLEREKG